MRRKSVTRVAAVVVVSLVMLIPATAWGGLRTRGFGPAIDYSGYEGQSKCNPTPKLGVLSFRSLVLTSFPIFGYGGISRACHIGGQSEHKEGRAWDMTANAAYESHRKAVRRLFGKLLATDRYGNEAGLARRLGVMYMIWNRKIWGTWGGGWRTYCVQKPRGCVDPDDGDLRHPHTDHVHFSFTWAGARKQTTYYNRDRSFISNLTAHPSWGYWLVGRNGSVNPFQTGWYGSKSDRFLDKPAVTMASTLSGYGYYLVTKGGRVYAFGDARNRGYIKGKRLTIVDIELTPTGNGYWLLAKSGRIFAFGDASNFGGAKEAATIFAAMAATPSGLGYWLFGTGGNVFAYGDAQDFGGLAGDTGSPIVGGDNFGAEGYWLVTSKGRVAAFGGAVNLGGAEDRNLSGLVVSLAANPTGTGYWLATTRGKVLSFGQAPQLGSLGSPYVADVPRAPAPSSIEE